MRVPFGPRWGQVLASSDTFSCLCVSINTSSLLVCLYDALCASSVSVCNMLKLLMLSMYFHLQDLVIFCFMCLRYTNRMIRMWAKILNTTIWAYQWRMYTLTIHWHGSHSLLRTDPLRVPASEEFHIGKARPIHLYQVSRNPTGVGVVDVFVWA